MQANCDHWCGRDTTHSDSRSSKASGKQKLELCSKKQKKKTASSQESGSYLQDQSFNFKQESQEKTTLERRSPKEHSQAPCQTAAITLLRFEQPNPTQSTCPHNFMVPKQIYTPQQAPCFSARLAPQRKDLYGWVKSTIPKMQNATIINFVQPNQDLPKMKESAVHKVHVAEPMQAMQVEQFYVRKQQKKKQSAALQATLKPCQKMNLTSKKQVGCVPSHQKHIKEGKLLGRGQYCHAYLCQDTVSNYLLVVKHIFKAGVSFNNSVRSNLTSQLSVDTPGIVSCYRYTEDSQRISAFQEFTPSLLEEEIVSEGKLDLGLVRSYLRQIIEATVMLHEGNRSHGNLNVSHIGCSLGVCKLRMSLTLPQPSSPDFLKDIHSIGVIGYQMAYGITDNNPPCEDTCDDPCTCEDPCPCDDPCPCTCEGSYPCEDAPSSRRRMITELRSKAVDAGSSSQLNDFLLSLLEEEEALRLSASSSLGHPFFCWEWAV